MEANQFVSKRIFGHNFRPWYDALLFSLLRNSGYVVIERKTLSKLIWLPETMEHIDEITKLCIEKELSKILQEDGSALNEKIEHEKEKVLEEIKSVFESEVKSEMARKIELKMNKVYQDLFAQTSPSIDSLPKPTNELGVMLLFGRYCDRLGFKIKQVQEKFPDCILKKDNGEEIRAEFEFNSRNFIIHDHDPDECDLVICWIHDCEKLSIPVLELKSALPFLDT